MLIGLSHSNAAKDNIYMANSDCSRSAIVGKIFKLYMGVWFSLKKKKKASSWYGITISEFINTFDEHFVVNLYNKTVLLIGFIYI